MTIPDSVTSIGSYAFEGCGGLTSVTIPQSVLDFSLKLIFPSAYSSLTNVDYSSVITNMGGALDIGGAFYRGAFEGCSGLTSVTIPDSVTSIGDQAFFGCSGLTSVTIPDSVTSIGGYAFFGCSALTSVTIPDSVTSIGSSAFSCCSALTNVTIPDGVTSIGDFTFNGCSALTSVTIPDGVTSIGDCAFSGCSGLTNVQVPNSVTYVGDYAFSANNIVCLTWPGELGVGRAFSAITVTTDEGTDLTYANSSIKTIVIANGSRYIADFAFCSISSLSNVIIPDSVASIGSSAFTGCSGLTSVTIPDGVTSIGLRAFSSCTDLTAITIPATVRWLDDEAFAGCSSLVSVTYLGDAPDTGANIYLGTPRALVSYVRGDSVGWSGGISGTIPSVWNERAMQFGWTVTFDAQGGVEDSRQWPGRPALVADGYGVGDLPSPTRDGYSFSGWFTRPTGGVRVTSATKVSGHVTYYAHWKANGTETGFVNYGGVVSDMVFAKAQTVLGALHDTKGGIVGTVELKFGKINARKGTVKVSASATMIIGGMAKKVGARAVTLAVDAAERIHPATLAFKAPIGEMSFELGGDGVFTLKNGAYEMVGAIESDETGRRALSVGGVLAKDRLAFNMEMDAMPNFGKDGVLLEEALPVDEPVYVAGGLRWSFGKAASLKYKKNHATGAYELLGLDDPNKPNRSSLKLSYAAKTGMFKGRFKLYATNEATTPAGKSPKLKAYTVNVIGFVVDGVGYGQATCKRPAASWAVTVE